jgi:hypothetical protein
MPFRTQGTPQVPLQLYLQCTTSCMANARKWPPDCLLLRLGHICRSPDLAHTLLTWPYRHPTFGPADPWGGCRPVFPLRCLSSSFRGISDFPTHIPGPRSADYMVSLTVRRTAVRIMTLNGKSRLRQEGRIMSDWVGTILERVERFMGSNWLEFLDKKAGPAVRQLAQRCWKRRARSAAATHDDCTSPRAEQNT